MKHNANTEIKGDLRVRGQVRSGLHVEDVVTAEAFYLKTGGEVGGGGSALTVEEEDGNPTIPNVTLLKFSNTTVTDNGGGSVSVAGGSGSNPRLNTVTAKGFYLESGGEWSEAGFQAIDGEFGAPSFTFQSNNALGLWNQSGTLIIEANDGLKAIDSIGSQIFSADREGFTAGNRVKAEAFYLKGGGDLSADQWLLPDGTQALPSLGLASQPDMGMYKEATDQLTFVIGNEEFLSFDATAIAVKIAKPLLIPDGTAIGPSIRFNSDASTAQSGIYKPGTGEIAIGADETEAMHFSKAGVRTPHKFKAENFYLGRGGDLSDDFITFQIETLSAKNYFIDVSAPYDYEISEVVLRSESGTGIASFYVDPVGGTGAGRYGRPIEGLIDFYITQDKQTFTITPFPIGQGDEWFMGVESVVEARDVAGTVRIRR
jgi:uncharacterized protein YneR